MTRLLCILTAAALLSVPGWSQTYGEITGSVLDTTGASIVGATVTVRNTATNQTRVVSSNDAGNYAIPFLVPAVYDIDATTPGFKTGTRKGLILQVGDTARVDFHLEIGAVTESVEVAATTPLLATDNTALGTVIEQKRIVELPLNGRNYLQLVRLSPNVSAEMGAGGQANSRQGGERSNQALSIAGQRQQYNRFTLDGVENTDPNFNTFVVRPSVDALQEFKVQTGVYSAEYGKATSQINVTTRSGTNQYHGTVFEFLRNDKIQARPWQSHGDKNPFRRNQFGFTVAGPVLKDKLFFMANYEGLRERVQGVRRNTVADAAMRAGDFSGPAHLPIYDPETIRSAGSGFTATPFPNARIPTSRFKQPFVKMLEFYPEPNVGGAVTGVSPFNYVRNAPNPLDWDQFTTRIDWQQSMSSQWFGRLSWGDELLTSGQNFEAQDERIGTKVWQVMLSNVRTLTPTVVNELRLGANLFDNDKLTRFNGIRDVTTELGVPGLSPPIEAAWGTPGIGFTGNNEVAGWGEATGGPFINRNRTYQIIDNISWVRGKHTLRFGGEASDRRFNQIGNQFPRGFFQFPSRYTSDPSNLSRTGSAFATGLLGWTSESTRALGIANLQFRQKSFYGYAEDTWKITPTLTMNIGVRYEYTPPWRDRYRGIFNVRMSCPGVNDQGIDPNCPVPVLVRPGAGDFHEGLQVHIADAVPKATGDDALFNHATIQNDRNDWAPRLGFSWQPAYRWTVRTGYGLFYSQDTGNPVFDMGRNLGFRESARSVDVIPTSNLDAPWAVKAGGGNLPCSNWDGLCLAGLYTFANDSRRRTPYIHQYMLNVQRQLTDTLLLEAGYMGNAGHKLQRMYGFNTPVERNGPQDQTSADNRRPWPNVYGRIQTIANVVNSNYNALGVKLQQRYTNGLTYLVGYTWSRAIDSGSAIRTNAGDNLFPASSYDLRSERGLSQFHTGQRLTASILYDLPFQFDNAFTKAALGGFLADGNWARSSLSPMARRSTAETAVI
ncbi:MAG: TonB-dependent receptor [Bryobacteraceae bacterium]